MRELKALKEGLSDGRLSRRDFIRRATLLGVSASALGPILAACGGGEEGDGGTGGEGEGASGLTLGFSLGTLAQRRWQFDKQYVEEHARSLGMEVQVQSAEDDERLQVSQVENLVAQGIDVLILSPINVETAAPAVTTAKQAGVPVVSYNSLVLNSDVDYWVARDNVLVGRIQAEAAVAKVPEGNYVICSGEPGVDIAREKTGGNMEVLQPHIDEGAITIISQEYHRAWDPASGLKQVEAALAQTNNKIDAILGNYDGFTLAALEALGEVDLVGETFLGGEDVFEEMAQAIVEGRADMSAYTDLREMATKAVDAATALGQGEEPESDDTIDNGFAEVPGSRISSFSVTAENMCQFLNDTGWLDYETVYANVPAGERPDC